MTDQGDKPLDFEQITALFEELWGDNKLDAEHAMERTTSLGVGLFLMAQSELTYLDKQDPNAVPAKIQPECFTTVNPLGASFIFRYSDGTSPISDVAADMISHFSCIVGPEQADQRRVVRVVAFAASGSRHFTALRLTAPEFMVEEMGTFWGGLGCQGLSIIRNSMITARSVPDKITSSQVASAKEVIATLEQIYGSTRDFMKRQGIDIEDVLKREFSAADGVRFTIDPTKTQGDA